MFVFSVSAYVFVWIKTYDKDIYTNISIRIITLKERNVTKLFVESINISEVARRRKTTKRKLTTTGTTNCDLKRMVTKDCTQQIIILTKNTRSNTHTQIIILTYFLVHFVLQNPTKHISYEKMCTCTGC